MLESDLDSTENTNYSADQRSLNTVSAISDKSLETEYPDSEFKQVKWKSQEEVECLDVYGSTENVNGTFKDESSHATFGQSSGNNESLIATQTEDVIEREIPETRNENEFHEETQIPDAPREILTIASDNLDRAGTKENSGYGSLKDLHATESQKQCDMPVVEATQTSMFESLTSVEICEENVLSESPVELMESRDLSNVDFLSRNNGKAYSLEDATTSVVHFTSITNDEVCTAIKDATLREIDHNISLDKNQLQAEWELHDSSFKEDWSNQDACMTAIVSADLEGWQRFDVEENGAATSCVGGGTPRQQQELWEQLLEDGLDSTENKNILDSPEKSMLDTTENNINSITFPTVPNLFDGGHSWLASPGNPFVENSDRISNFSEAEGFAIPNPGYSYGHQESSMDFEEDPFRDASGNNDLMPRVDPRSNRSLATQNAKDSSFGANFVDPESSALFTTSEPVYQRAGYDPGHEAWEANFDTTVPFSAQNGIDPNGAEEISRSLSMPRMADQRHGAQEVIQQEQDHRWSFSAASREVATSATANKKKHLPKLASELKSAVVVSPRISPLVKKVVKKIQTSQVTSSVLKSTSQSPNPVVSVPEKPKKSIWARLICCSKID